MGVFVVTCKCGNYFLATTDDLDIKKAIKCSKCGGMNWTREIENKGR